MRVVGSQAMSSGIYKSPDRMSLGLMSFKHPFLLITDPVVVLNESILLLLESLVALRSLVGIVIVDVSMG